MYDIEPLIASKEENHKQAMIDLRERAKHFERMHFKIRTLGLSCEVPELSDWNVQHGFVLDIVAADLPVLYATFGKPEIYGKEIKDKATGTIWIHVQFPDQPYCGVIFRYEKQLSEGDKCKIVTQTNFEDKLVCNI